MYCSRSRTTAYLKSCLHSILKNRLLNLLLLLLLLLLAVVNRLENLDLGEKCELSSGLEAE
eukprot:SAG31_NODE_2019_length_6660_cov_2.597775_4_plen_61_part_00